jgi:hypothetical protein
LHIVIRARTQNELTPVSGLFGEDVLFDERPPALVDFLDDTVAFSGRT